MIPIAMVLKKKPPQQNYLRGYLVGAIEIFTGWLCSKFIQHLQERAKQFRTHVQRVPVGMIKSALTGTRGLGWSKSGGFGRTYFLKYPLKNFTIQTMNYLTETTPYVADNK